MQDSDNDESVQIKLKTEQLSIEYSQLCKHSQLAQEKSIYYHGSNLLTELIEQFQSENEIKDSSFKSFVKIINDENAEIQKDEFNDLYTLRNFFKADIITDTLKEFLSKNSADINMIIDLLNEHRQKVDEFGIENDDITSIIENNLSNNIEKCFKNEKFNKLQIATLYRIFQRNNRPISDELLDFIQESIQDRYILFTFLNTELLSDSKFDKLYDDFVKSKGETTNHYHYDPIRKDLIYTKKLKEMKTEQEKLQKQIDELKEENRKLEINQKLTLKEFDEAKEKSQTVDFDIITKAILPQFPNWIFLAIACGKGNLKLTQYLVQSGMFSILDRHEMYLHSACGSGNLELVKYIAQFRTSSIWARTILNSKLFE